MRKQFQSLSMWLRVAVLLALVNAPARADDLRFGIACTINGKPVNFVLDTGASASFIFHTSATRIGLRIIPQPVDSSIEVGHVQVDSSEKCMFAINGGAPVRRAFFVEDVPSQILEEDKVDGLLSWKDLASDAFLIDASKPYFEPVPSPKDIEPWTKWQMVPGADVLMFERSDGGKTTRIGVDTGNPEGIMLTRENWKKWRAAHAGQPVTGELGWSASSGFYTKEILRTSEFDAGKLSIPDVPVTTDIPTAWNVYKQCDAVLGLFALTRVRLIIDYKAGAVYTSPVPYPGRTFDYNRLGAFFAPNIPPANTVEAAHVIKGSPADEAGIREGDVLLKINDSDKQKEIWKQTPGTRVKLLVGRGGATREFTVTLKELGETAWELPPEQEQKGNAAFQRGDYAGAITCFTQLIQSDPQNARWHVLRSAARDKRQDYDGAIADLDDAVRLKPGNLPQCLFNRGAIREEKGENDKAIADYSEAIRLNPDYDDACFSRAMLYEAAGRHDGAYADYSKVIRLYPGNMAAYNNRAGIDLGYGDAQAAFEDADTAIHIDPDYVLAYNNRGYAYQCTGLWSEAIADYKEAIRHESGYAAPCTNLSYLLATCPDPAFRDGKKAVEYALKAGELNEWKDPADLSTLAAAYAEAGDFAKAVKFETQYIATPGLGPYELSDSRRRLALYRQAKSFHAPVLQESILRAEAYKAISKEDLHGAIDDFTQAIQADPGDPSPHIYRAGLFFNNGDFEKTATDYTEAIRLDPENAEVYNADAWFLATCPDARIRDGAKAVEFAKKACDLTQWKNPHYIDTLAAAYAEAGDFKQAIKSETDYLATPNLPQQNSTAAQARLTLYQQGKPYHEESKK